MVVSISLMFIKLLAYGLTGSAAVLSDALESTIHIVTSGFALFSVWLAAQPRDSNHPYGHGKVEYLSAAVEGTLVAVAGVGILVIAVQRLRHPETLARLDEGLVLSLIAGIVSFATGWLLIRAGKHHESPALEADGVHLRADAFTTAGGIVSLFLVRLTGLVWIDTAIAIILALWLLVNGFMVVRRAVGGLMDEAVPELLDRVAGVLNGSRAEGWVDPHNCKIQRLGQVVHIDMHLVLPRFWSLDDAHREAHHAEDAIRDDFGQGTEVMLVFEPCTRSSCKRCDVNDCPVRDAAFEGRITLTGELISRRYRAYPGDKE